MDARPLLQASALLLCVGALAYYGYGGLDNEDVSPTFDSSRPDYIADGIRAWSTDKQGQRTQTLSGQRLTHYNNPVRYELNNPVLSFSGRDGSAWSVRSIMATSTEPNSDTWLEGNVIANRQHTSMPLTFNTERLHVNIAGNLIHTPERVVLRSAQSSMMSAGMRADLSKQTLELLSSVEVTYAPSR